MVAMPGPAHVDRAVILAAGKGTRLQPLTEDVPKCLVEVGGEPLLERALHALAANGVSEAIVVIGYGGNVIQERLGSSFARSVPPIGGSVASFTRSPGEKELGGH